jgi:sulfur-oxidizing protein SoxX
VGDRTRGDSYSAGIKTNSWEEAMQSIRITLAGLTAASVMLATGLVAGNAAAEPSASTLKEGQSLAFTRSKGNCLACHMIEGGESPGNIGPPLLLMSSRFPDKATLRAQIENPMVRNPETSMPAFGKYQVLSSDEMDSLVEYIWSL